jgi:hypothetical protein
LGENRLVACITDGACANTIIYICDKLNNHEAMNILLQHEEFLDVWLKENEKLCGERYERDYQKQKQLAESCDYEIYKRIAGYVLGGKP